MEPIVFLPEAFRFHIYFLDVPEQMGVQYIFPIGSVEPFDETVLARLAGLYIFYIDILHFTIVYKDPGYKFRAVVHPYGKGLAMDLYGLPQILHHPYSRHGEVSFHTKCLTVEIVHHVEDPEAPSRNKAVGHEVRAPYLPWCIGHLQRLFYPFGQTFPGLSPELHAQEAIDPQNPFAVPFMALFADTVVEPVEAPVGLGLGQFRKLVDDFRIVAAAPIVPHRTAEAYYRTGPGNAQARFIDDVLGQFSTLTGPQSFFSMMSFRIR